MPRLERLPAASRTTLLNLPVQINQTAPLTSLRKPLAECCLALVTTAGLHRRGDRLFTPGDQTYRELPSLTPGSEIVQSHTSIGFDRAPTLQDINICFPLDRARELVERGALGSLATGYSFMGALRETDRLQAETGPEVARRLIGDGVDVVLLTPT